MNTKINDVLMMKPFTEHPHQQGITYIDHWFFAMGIAYRLVTISFKFALHERNPWIENAGEKPDAQFNTVSHTLVDQA